MQRIKSFGLLTNVLSIYLIFQPDCCEVVLKLILLFHLDVLGKQILVVDGVLNVLVSLLNAGLQPVFIVLSWLHVL